MLTPPRSVGDDMERRHQLSKTQYTQKPNVILFPVRPKHPHPTQHHTYIYLPENRLCDFPDMWYNHRSI
jgi:hypothetical protein